MRQKAIKDKEVVYSKGSLAETKEEGGHLYYSYLPQYQRDRWFEVRDREGKRESQTIEVVSERNKGKSMKKPTKNKYMFAYLESFIKAKK